MCVGALVQTLNFAAMTNHVVLKCQWEGVKLVDAPTMVKREDFVPGMVQTSQYQRAATWNAATKPEMEMFATSIIWKVSTHSTKQK